MYQGLHDLYYNKVDQIGKIDTTHFNEKRPQYLSEGIEMTKSQLKQIIREELEKLDEIPTWRKLKHQRDGTPHPGLHPGPRDKAPEKKDHDGDACAQAHPDQEHEA